MNAGWNIIEFDRSIESEIKEWQIISNSTFKNVMIERVLTLLRWNESRKILLIELIVSQWRIIFLSVYNKKSFIEFILIIILSGREK